MSDIKDIEARVGTLEERFDNPNVVRKPFDESTPPDVPCRLCAADVARADEPVCRRKRWYCSIDCADEMDPLEAA